MKCVAKFLVGMVSLCIFGVEQDWYCLIDSLVVLCSHVTCTFIANTLYMASIYMYISLACLYMVFIYPYVSHMCSCIAHMLHLLSMTQSHVRDSSTCNMVCCHYDNPTSAPIGNPSMARLPWGLYKHAILACL